MHRRGIQICLARMGLVSNQKELITKPEYFSDQILQSLLTDYHRIDEIPWREDLDTQITVIDVPGLQPSMSIGRDQVLAVGDWSRLEATVHDRRYTLFGNMGFLYRYVIRVLEEHHQVFTFHASAMVDEDRGELWLIPGGPGAGKTVFLLGGIARGWSIFSTEMTHCRLTDGGYEFYKGSLFDNVRIGTLLYDFPAVIERLGLKLPQVTDVWAVKATLDLRSVASVSDTLENPPVHIIHPKVESGRDRAEVTAIDRREKLVKLLFDNASEKLGQTTLLYECLPVPPMDTSELMAHRIRGIEELLDRAKILSAKATFCSPQNCMEGIG